MQLLGFMTYFSWLLVTELVDTECQIQDGSEDSLRDNLPEAVGILNRAIQERVKEPGDTVYLHCCEGLGRSPSVAVAYLYWFTNMTVSFRCSTCIYAPCECLFSTDLFILATGVLVCHLIVTA